MGFNGRNVMKTKNKEKFFLSRGIEIQFFFHKMANVHKRINFLIEIKVNGE